MTGADEAPTPEQLERLLLAQQRRGHARLRFVPMLERLFVEHRVRRLRRRLPLIAATAVLFQLIYTFLDFALMPTAVAGSVLPLRLLALGGLAVGFFYCRRPHGPPKATHAVYATVYALNGGCVALIVHFCWAQGVPMPYEGLFLILLFGYVLLGLSFRAASLSAWGFCGLFLLPGLWFSETRASLAYPGLFLVCANLIGSVGAYLQEHGQRSAWLNLRLLDLARLRAEADDARKLRLLAAASHDLRQPLNAMGLYAQHLLEQTREPLTRQVGERLVISVEQLSRLLQSLLDFTRLTLPGGVQARPENLPLRPLLARLVDEAQAEIEQSDCQLRLECGELWVRSDALLLERLLRNLLNNALRHAGARHVWLRAEAQGDEVLLEVGDDGRGLAAEEQELIFEEFRQLDNPGRNAERGLGLGLAIVRQLAALLEHPLRLDSRPGEGARFSLRLPAVAPGAEVSQSAAPAKVLAGRILLLEDDPAGREALQGLLQRWGCEVEVCADLPQALGRQAAFRPQVLISDYRLAGEEDGLKAIERLREAAGQMLPALLISADVSPELQERCMPAHVTLLAKPLLPARLRRALALSLPEAVTASRAAAPH
ncbi:ATP-binding response regulator [Pseudomonas indica]|uniref:ATP-binding response regulator n=1 Tax=Pseudomonas indica TaxID=137658 RepID=UPI0023F9F864|nr:hybrid sensor histidine kinase/response regulator [Pseudomonas indica]MBU3056100.1 hybrid sensor histidine kinase/response regulator [Pseudomonas indica]